MEKPLFNTGMALAEEIKGLEFKNLEHSEETELLNRKMTEYQDHAFKEINSAETDEGKKKYTNESQRSIARKDFLRDSQEYNQCIDDLNTIKKTMKVNDIEIKYRVYRLRLINSYMRMNANE